MTTTIIFSALGAVLLLSIVISAIAQKRQQAIVLKNNQINQLSRKINNLQEIIDTLLTVDIDYELILIIHLQMVRLYEKKLTLAPGDKKLQEQITLLEQTRNNYKNGKRDTEISKALSSDDEIKLTAFQLSQALKIIKKLEVNKLIPRAKFNELSNHVARINLDIEVESHIAQAEKYRTNSDIIMAQSHLKQARNALKNTPIEFPEKAQLIRTLTDSINTANKNNTIEVADD